MIRWAAAWTVLGIVVNRFNVSPGGLQLAPAVGRALLPEPGCEIGVSLFIVTIGVVAYRFVTTRMPILYEHPDYRHEH
jgi:hypothetical protein